MGNGQSGNANWNNSYAVPPRRSIAAPASSLGTPQRRYGRVWIVEFEPAGSNTYVVGGVFSNEKLAMREYHYTAQELPGRRVRLSTAELDVLDEPRIVKET